MSSLKGWKTIKTCQGGEQVHFYGVGIRLSVVTSKDIQIVYVFPERLENNKNLSGWGASPFLWGGDKAQCGDIQRHPDCVRLP